MICFILGTLFGICTQKKQVVIRLIRKLRSQPASTTGSPLYEDVKPVQTDHETVVKTTPPEMTENVSYMEHSIEVPIQLSNDSEI